MATDRRIPSLWLRRGADGNHGRIPARRRHPAVCACSASCPCSLVFMGFLPEKRPSMERVGGLLHQPWGEPFPAEDDTGDGYTSHHQTSRRLRLRGNTEAPPLFIHDGCQSWPAEETSFPQFIHPGSPGNTPPRGQVLGPQPPPCPHPHGLRAWLWDSL